MRRSRSHSPPPCRAWGALRALRGS